MRYSEDTAKQQRRIELAASLFNTTVPRRAFSVCHTRKLSYLSCFVWIVSKSNGAASSFRAVLVEDKLCITLFKWLGRPLSLIPVLNQVFENEFMTVFYYHVHCMQNVQGGLCGCQNSSVEEAQIKFKVLGYIVAEISETKGSQKNNILRKYSHTEVCHSIRLSIQIYPTQHYKGSTIKTFVFFYQIYRHSGSSPHCFSTLYHIQTIS